MIKQLRIYEIEKDLKSEFDTRFREHAARIMGKYDFHILAMWYSEGDDRTEFIYILEWPDVSTMYSQWNAFMSDQEWKDIKGASKAKYGEMVLSKVKDQVLDETDWFKNIF